MTSRLFRMREPLRLLPLCLLLALACACGEDRTYEYDEKTGCGHWMEEVMRANYLWGDSLEELSWKKYFGKPATILGYFTAQAPVTDSWSWCAIDTVEDDGHERGYFNHFDSYGLDFVVMTDPTGATSRQYARIMTVYAGSPADRCGLERGDFVAYIDGSKFTSSLASRLQSGASRTLVVNKLGVDEAESAFEWTSVDTLTLAASEYVEDRPFPVVRTFEKSVGKVVYLQCNRLTEGPTEVDSTSVAYETELHSVLASIAAQEPYALVLDLRLCNDGTLGMARQLASYLASGATSSDLFATTFYRTDLADQNEQVAYDANALGKNLGLTELYVITSGYTTGAGEWLIRGLQNTCGADFIATLGTATAGQNVMTKPFANPQYYVTLHPVVAYVGDGSGDYDYADGIDPDAELDETTYVNLYPYGDSREALLSLVLSQWDE